MPEEITQQVNEFFSSYRKVLYPKGQLLLFPGELTNNAYYLESGRVSVYDVSYRGAEIILFTFLPNSYFPMSSVVNNIASRFFYKTDTEAVVRIAPSEEFNAFIKANSDMSYYLLSRAYSRFEYILERTLHLITGTAKDRLVFELIVEYKNYGVGDDTSGYIEASESSIASKAGLSRETVSREMRHLKDAKLVQIKDHKIYIIDLPRLNAMLDLHA